MRVHQQFLNQDNWPVTAVYEYLGSTISKTGYSASDMLGEYEFVNHGKDASTKNVGMLTTQKIKLNSNGKITGDVTGSWSYIKGTYYCQMVIDGVMYKGVFFKQKDETPSHNEVMTFSLIGKNNQTIWGTKNSVKVSKTEGIFYIRNKFSGKYLDVADGSSADHANIQQWAYNGFASQKYKIVSNGDGYYYILTGASNYTKALDVAMGSAADGTNIVQYSLNKGTNQLFKLSKQSDGTYAVLSKASSCKSGLDVYDWSRNSGGNINQWNFWGGDCQKWILVAVK